MREEVNRVKKIKKIFAKQEEKVSNKSTSYVYFGT